MAKLTEAQKAFIVSRLACFYTPSEVVEAVTLEFGLSLTRQQIGKYDPHTVIGERLSEELKALFAETRERFLNDVQAIPIANRSYRLRRLQNIIDDDKHRRNPVLVRETLEQAAKEVGDVFTNKTKAEVSAPNGGPSVIREVVIFKNGSSDPTETEAAGSS